jgi:DNA primase
MSWFRGEEKSIPVWVVEDQLSAMRLWQYGLTAVALLGTHISHERAVEIKSVSDDVFLALDKDATAKSIGYASTFRYVLNTKVVALSKDVKDMDSNELSNLLKTGCSEWS